MIELIKWENRTIFSFDSCRLEQISGRLEKLESDETSVKSRL